MSLFIIISCVYYNYHGYFLAQSASSGRMVELMGGEVGAGVIGFEAVSSGLVQPGASGNSEGVPVGAEGLGGEGGVLDEVTPGASTKFQVVMKQLSKKDTTTKLKVCATCIIWLDWPIQTTTLE